MLRRVTGAVFALAVLVLAALPAASQQQSPAAIVEQMNGALLQAMQNADQLGFEGRYQLLEPVLRDTFDFSSMARFAVGPTYWPELSEAQQQQLIDSFSRMSIATFADRFDGYSGQSFRVVDQREGPRETLIVRTQLVRPDDSPVNLDYVMRQTPEGWQVIDIFLDGRISELSRQRSEYTAVLSRRGFDGLISEIETVIERHRSG